MCSIHIWKNVFYVLLVIVFYNNKLVECLAQDFLQIFVNLLL